MDDDSVDFSDLVILDREGKAIPPELNEFACLISGNSHGLTQLCDPHYASRLGDGMYVDSDETVTAADIINVALGDGWIIIPPSSNPVKKLGDFLTKLFTRNIHR